MIEKLVTNFDGRIVKKDLTQLLKSGANVPTFVLEYLLGMYCATTDEEQIKIGVEKVRKILNENFMRPDESELIRSRIRENGQYTVIDKISASLNEVDDVYEATFTTLDIGKFVLDADYIRSYEKILMGGIWVIAKVGYLTPEEREIKQDSLFGDLPKNKRKVKKGSASESPFTILSLKPIQMSNVKYREVVEARSSFTKEEWMDLLLRSIGFEPHELNEIEKWHFLLRMVPFIEKNYNLVELGPRSTGKSYIFKEVSPYSILLSGGKASAASIFYNMARRSVGLVGLWDVIAFDEVAGLSQYDGDVIQIMKDYMANGSFSRGRDVIVADGSMVFQGNIDEEPEILLKTNHLFQPFPSTFSNDAAFFDRIHYYLPGWEVPKLGPQHFTQEFGLISDYLAEFVRAMRKKDFSIDYQGYFNLNKDCNQRDTIAIRKTVSGLLKLLYPNGEYTKEEIREVLEYAIIGRRRVKEQLKKMLGKEFADVNLGYFDLDTGEEIHVYTNEQPKSLIMEESKSLAGQVFAIGTGMDTNLVGVFKLENAKTIGDGKFIAERIGSSKQAKECYNAAWEYFKQYHKNVSTRIKIDDNNFLLSFNDIQSNGVCDNISLAQFIALCSIALDTPVLDGLAILGNFNLAGIMQPSASLPDVFRIAKNAGVTKILIPIEASIELGKVLPEYLNGIIPIFYMNPVDAARKALEM